eukprot:PRCOL_00006865-RA
MAGARSGAAQRRLEAAADALVALVREAPDDISRYTLLRAVQASAPSAFHAALARRTAELLPLVYTPTVGDACARYHTLDLPRAGSRYAGLYLSSADKGNVLEALRSRWPSDGRDVRVVVLTDGERILGLGDLGAGGMGISVGKILLYTAVAGVDPGACVPMLIDVGTNNEAVRSAPGYGGVRAPRLRGDAYASLLSEVVHAVRAWAPRAVLQFEDFGNTNAFTLLRAHRTTLPCFNDDIEGTASVACAAVLAAVRAQAGAGAGARLSAQRFLFLGAGEAGTGIADLIVLALVRRHGLSEAEARRRCVFLDSKGLVCASRLEGGGAGALPPGHPRRGLADHKVAYAHPLPFVRTLLEAVHAVRPTVLVGVSTKRGAFTPDVLRALADGCAREGLRPLVMPLSNPTDMSECTYQDALAHAGDGVLFASGSPFPPCAAMGRLGPRRAPPQANNAYVFPAIGRAAYETCARAIDAEAFLVAAEALAALPTDADVADGALFPPVASMAEASLKVCAAVCVHAQRSEAMRGRSRGVPARSAAQWERYLARTSWSPAAILPPRAKM